MAEIELPDDPRDWPKDPYELLGIDRQSAAADAKRAYLRLVRRFKPEHFPEQFQLIRQAYDRIEAQRQSRYYFQSQDELPGTRTVEIISSAGSAETTEHPRPHNPRDAWRLALAGEHQAAYRQLLDLHHREPNQAEYSVGLYWLLTADPEVDPGASREDYLVAALRGAGFYSQAWQLYRRAALAHPQEAFSERFDTLLQATTAIEDLLKLLTVRWQVALRYDNYSRVIADLALMQHRFVEAGLESWARLLFLAADHLAWGPAQVSQQAFVRCGQELNDLPHLHHAFDREFSRLDMLRDVRHGLQLVTRDYDIRSWLAALPYFWIGDTDEVHIRLATIYPQLLRDPFWSLATLDAIGRSNHTLLHLLCELLAAGRNDDAEDDEQNAERREPAAVQELVWRLLRRHANGIEYENLRKELLDLCIQELIDPRLVAAISSTIPGIDYQFIELMRADSALIAVYSAHLAVVVY